MSNRLYKNKWGILYEVHTLFSELPFNVVTFKFKLALAPSLQLVANVHLDFIYNLNLDLLFKHVLHAYRAVLPV